jgi:hypothetical protein
MSEVVAAKPSEAYSQDELRETKVYKDLRKSYGNLPDDAVENIARSIIQETWNAKKNETIKEELGNIFRRLKELGYKSSLILLNEEEMTISEKRAKTVRWTHKNYASLIGKSFSKEVVSSKFEDRNGKYEFHIEPPHPDHEVPFKCRLVQHDGYEVRFPGVDPENLQVTDTYREVKSVTNVMRESVLNHPQSPAVFFKIEHPEKGAEEETSE